MAQVKITSPVSDFSGVSAGVRFSDGEATIDDKKQLAALEYFNRHGFGIGSSKAAPANASETPPIKFDELDEAARGKLTREALDAEATNRGLTPGDHKTKGDLLAAIEATITEPNTGDVTGDGKVDGDDLAVRDAADGDENSGE